jgi:predicted amidophosphoribosyltransferase
VSRILTWFFDYLFGVPFYCPGCGTKPVERAPYLCGDCIEAFPFNPDLAKSRTDLFCLGLPKEPLLTWVRRVSREGDYRLAWTLGHVLGMFAEGERTLRTKEGVVFAPRLDPSGSYDFRRILAQQVANYLSLPITSLDEYEREPDRKPILLVHDILDRDLEVACVEIGCQILCLARTSDAHDNGAED